MTSDGASVVQDVIAATLRDDMLAGQAALVVGGTSGIGAAIAARFMTGAIVPVDGGYLVA
jgi:hypothetical protein